MRGAQRNKKDGEKQEKAVKKRSKDMQRESQCFFYGSEGNVIISESGGF